MPQPCQFWCNNYLLPSNLHVFYLPYSSYCSVIILSTVLMRIGLKEEPIPMPMWNCKGLWGAITRRELENSGFWISGTLKRCNNACVVLTHGQMCDLGVRTERTVQRWPHWRISLLNTNMAIKTTGKTLLWTPQNGLEELEQLEQLELVWNRGNLELCVWLAWESTPNSVLFWKTALQPVKNTTFGLGRCSAIKCFLHLQRTKFSSQ